MSEDSNAVDVVVVGAGLAGLRCAELLADRGLEVTVLEARERVGGRTLSRRVGAAMLDLGGQWIGPGQHRLADLARRLGVATHPTHHEGRKVIEIDGQRSTYRGDIPSLSVFNLVELQLLLARIRRKVAKIDQEAPWTSNNADKLDEMTVEEWKNRTVFGKDSKAMVDLLIRSVWSAEPRELSMLYFLHYAATAGDVERLTSVTDGAQQLRFVGGAQQLSERLAERMKAKLSLGCPVREVARTDTGAIVHTDGLTVRCKRVVIAIAPVLAGRIAHQPPLPAAREQLMQRMPMGATIKCLALYDRPFWRDKGLSGEAVVHGATVCFTFDNTCHSGAQSNLVAFVTGDQGRLLSGQQDTLRARVLDDLGRLFGPQARQPTHFEAFDWSAEMFSGGCPVGLGSPGTLTSYGPALREPVGPIHWAGTETAVRWCGYMEGALQSAERVADEIIGGLQVRGSDMDN